MELNCTPEVKIILDSRSRITDQRITTFQIRYQRFVHSEVLTHRVFSRNASSSRAIPVKKMLEQVSMSPASPVHWGANQSGMQAKEELKGEALAEAKKLWELSAKSAVRYAKKMEKIGLHKQVANRILEPYQFISVVLTATNFDNFWELRVHPDAQPEFQALARVMKQMYDVNEPQSLTAGQYHIPYILPEEWDQYTIQELTMFSVARCARVSYLTHDKKTPKPEDDIALYQRLVGSKPLHASPTEHQARVPLGYTETMLNGNFSNGFVQFRKCLEMNTFDLFWEE